MTERLDWDTDGGDWPNRNASQFVRAGGIRWHVQTFGRGPPLLLIHGTAASTHSWRLLAPLLARTHSVLACDLPGHGFTDSLPGRVLSLSTMAKAVSELLQAMDFEPDWAIGHSAGAAILIRMCRDGGLKPSGGIIGLNAALQPFGGVSGRLFSPLARLLAASPLVAKLCNWRAGDVAAVDRVITGTGSKLDPTGLELYARLFRNPVHVAAALNMMANWNLDSMADDIAHLQYRLLLVACSGDLAVPAESAFQIRDHAAAVTVELVRGLGHLAHEEQPDVVAALLLRLMTVNIRPNVAVGG